MNINFIETNNDNFNKAIGLSEEDSDRVGDILDIAINKSESNGGIQLLEVLKLLIAENLADNEQVLAFIMLGHFLAKETNAVAETYV